MWIEWYHFSKLISLIMTGGNSSSSSSPLGYIPKWLDLELDLYEQDRCFQTVSPARSGRLIDTQHSLLCPSGLTASKEGSPDIVHESSTEPIPIDWAKLDLIYHGEPSDYCLIYPPPAPGLADRLVDWLLEPMPETWLVAALDPIKERVRNQPPPGEVHPYRLEELDRSRLGLFPLLDPKGNQQMGFSAWKVCDAGTNRYDLLRAVRRLHTNPLNSLTGTGLSLASQRIFLYVVFRRASLDCYRCAPPIQLFETALYVPNHYAALPDTLTLLATLARYTKLTASEMLALLALIYLPAMEMYHVAYSAVRSNSSMVLQTFILSWMTEQESALLQTLLTTALRDKQTDWLKLVPTFQLEGITFRYTNLCGRAISNQILFQSWMLVRSQLGLPTASWEDLTAEQFTTLLRTNRSIES